MGEKKIIVDGLTISYEGYFHANDLYRLINKFTLQRGYDPAEVLHELKVKEDGRYTVIDMRPTKSISDYVQFMIQTKIAYNKVTDEMIELEGKQIKINKGSVKIVINGYIFSDYEGNWESSPRAVFFKVFFDKIIFKKQTDDFNSMLKGDCMLLRNEISAFLNLHKYIKSF